MNTPPDTTTPNYLMRVLGRQNVQAGLFFIAMAILGLWLSRNYTVGSALRMGGGYVPRLLCWIMMGLGGIILFQGLREQSDSRLIVRGLLGWWPVAVVSVALIVFSFMIDRHGLLAAVILLIGIGSIADRTLRWQETVLAAAVLALVSWLIFIKGLSLPMRVWPDL